VPLSRRALLVTLAAIPALAAQPAAQDRRHSRLFKPEQLGVLEGPDREAWQKPDLIMDDLGIFDGSTVADLGAGGGWFTVRLARRVGPTGRVYAEDIQPEMIETMNRRIQREALKNVTVVLGSPVDPALPKDAIDAVLIVGTYGELENPVALLRNVRKALRPNGRIGVVDYRSDGLGPGPPLEERVDPAEVMKDAEAAGLRLIKRDTPLPFQFLLVFGAAAPPTPPRSAR
jgi:predicted methyltransferase